MRYFKNKSYQTLCAKPITNESASFNGKSTLQTSVKSFFASSSKTKNGFKFWFLTIEAAAVSDVNNLNKSKWKIKIKRSKKMISYNFRSSVTL